MTTQPLGSQAKLVDGNVVQAWTITNLRTSSDTIPYPVAGTLWEATATDEAIEGGATPIVSNLNARAGSGQTYRALFQVPTAEGVNPATLAQGEKTTGKVYFDVTGDVPDSVVYNAGGQDLLLWVQPPPAPRTATRPTQYPSSGQGTAAPAATPATPVPAAPGTTPAPAATATTPVPGAPMPAATQTVPGAPLPTGSQGTPLPAGSQGTPLPADVQGAPAAAGSQGTPAGAEGAPVPASTGGAPQPAGSQGTPATPVTTVPRAPAG
ncbi:DUF1942 domain-containing protein [Mycobacterium sp. MMS18-G62]